MCSLQPLLEVSITVAAAKRDRGLLLKTAGNGAVDEWDIVVAALFIGAGHEDSSLHGVARASLEDTTIGAVHPWRVDYDASVTLSNRGVDADGLCFDNPCLASS